MGLFYKPKHHTPRFQIPWDTIHAVLNFIVDETVWYILWWGSFIASIFRKLYQFGEWIVQTGIKLIDRHDEFWDKIEDKFMKL